LVICTDIEMALLVICTDIEVIFFLW